MFKEDPQTKSSLGQIKNLQQRAESPVRKLGGKLNWSCKGFNFCKHFSNVVDIFCTFPGSELQEDLKNKDNVSVHYLTEPPDILKCKHWLSIFSSSTKTCPCNICRFS